MLKKLFKYDFADIYKVVSVFYLLTVVFAVITRILFYYADSLVMQIISRVSMGIMISLMANCFVNTLIRNWVRFKETIYGNESYLTHTLPCSKNSIYVSKLIVSFISIITTIFIILISLIIAFGNKKGLDAIWQFIINFAKSFNTNPVLFVILFISIVVLEVFSALQGGFLGIILGHKKNHNKTAISVILGFLFYFAIQGIIVLVLYISGLFNANVMKIFTSTNFFGFSEFFFVAVISIIAYLIINAALSLASVKGLKHINVE